MNLTFPHMGIQPWVMYLSIFFGLIPWNFLTCQAGQKLVQFANKNDIFTKDLYVKLFCVAAFYIIAA